MRSPWSDSWFLNRVPLVIASRYGQDMPLHFNEETAKHFHAYAHWAELRTVSFAQATMLEYVLIHFALLRSLILFLAALWTTVGWKGYEGPFRLMGCVKDMGISMRLRRVRKKT